MKQHNGFDFKFGAISTGVVITTAHIWSDSLGGESKKLKAVCDESFRWIIFVVCHVLFVVVEIKKWVPEGESFHDTKRNEFLRHSWIHQKLFFISLPCLIPGDGK